MRNRLLVGLDVDKMLEFTQRGSQLYLRQASLQRDKIRKQKVAVAISGDAIISKKMIVAAGMSDLEIENAVWLSAKKYFPDLIEEIWMDFHRTAVTEVTWVAARKEIITQRVEEINATGLQVKVVDVDYYALQRAVRLLNLDLTEKVIAIIDVSLTRAIWVVQKDTHIIYTRSQVIDGHSMLGESQAAHLINHVMQFLQFYSSVEQHVALDQLVISGECALLPELGSLIAAQINILTIIANPFENVVFYPHLDMEFLRTVAPAFMLCSGLALRTVNDYVH